MTREGYKRSAMRASIWCYLGALSYGAASALAGLSDNQFFMMLAPLLFFGYAEYRRGRLENK